MEDSGSKDTWYTFDVDMVFQRLGSGRHGLMSDDVNKRLSASGFNGLPETKRISPIGSPTCTNHCLCHPDYQ